MYQIPFQTSRAPCHKEGRDLQHHCFMDSAKVSFALRRGGGGGGLLCLRGSRAKRRATTNIRETDLEIKKGPAGPS